MAMTTTRWIGLPLIFAAALWCREAPADEPPTQSPVPAAGAPAQAPAAGAPAQAPAAGAPAQAPAPAAAVAVFGDDGARLLLDGREAGTLPLAVPLLVPEGAHKLRLEKGRRSAQAQLKLVANRPVQVRFTLVPPLALVTPTQAALLAPILGAAAISDSQRQRLLAVVQRAAAQERVLLLPPEQLAGMRAASPQLAACAPETLQCQEQLAAQAEAQYVLVLQIDSAQRSGAPSIGSAQRSGAPSIGSAQRSGAPSIGSAQPEPGGDQQRQGAKAGQAGQAGKPEELRRWAFTVKLYDVRAAAEAAAQQRECAACGVQRAGQVLAELVGQVAQEGATRPRGTVAVTSQPAGAEVKLDGRLLGPAPARSDAFAGEHQVSLVLRGYRPYQARVTVADGQEAQVPAALQKEPVPVAAPVLAPPPPRAPEPVAKPFFKKWWFWTAVGVVVSGAVVLSAVELSGSPPRDYPNARVLSF